MIGSAHHGRARLDAETGLSGWARVESSRGWTVEQYVKSNFPLHAVLQRLLLEASRPNLGDEKAPNFDYGGCVRNNRRLNPPPYESYRTDGRVLRYGNVPLAPFIPKDCLQYRHTRAAKEEADAAAQLGRFILYSVTK